ncbi:MAG: HdeD family acid-resistance protein [Steroidobacteraceae bacterium]
MSTDKLDAQRTAAAITNSLRAHWKFFLIEGIVLVIFGLIAVCVPPLATVTVEILIGWLILLSGVLGLVMTFQTRGSPGFGWSLLSAVVGILVGIVLLMWPLSGVFSLTVMLTVFLALEGIVSIMYALAHRREKSSRWEMMLISGIVDLILAGLILAGLPGTAAWAIGLIVGVNLFFGGVALIAMAMQARSGGVPRSA